MKKLLVALLLISGSIQTAYSAEYGRIIKTKAKYIDIPSQYCECVNGFKHCTTVYDTLLDGFIVKYVRKNGGIGYKTVRKIPNSGYIRIK